MNWYKLLISLGCLLPPVLANAAPVTPAPPPTVTATAAAAPYALRPEQLAVVVNDSDPNSVAISKYYLAARNIPEKNLIHIQLPPNKNRLDAASFRFLRQGIHAQLRPEIQAILMIWTAPYAVECNSITSAMTFGYDAAQCKKTCDAGKVNPYYDSESVAPYRDFGIRPSMLMPVQSLEQAKALIDRGVMAGFQAQEANAFYLQTSDKARNSRVPFFPPTANVPQKKLRVKTLQRDFLEGERNIILYQTGAAQVPKLETLHFLPGALADHLTSFGGDLLGSGQMSSLRWLEAGATASFGTVSEPCNHWQKFPQPTILLKHYLAGASALEAYWKSLAWPTQGLLIGEPLAAPYRR